MRERWAVGLADLALAPLGWLGRLQRRGRQPAAPDTVLLLRLERIGDLLMTRDAIGAVRERVPDARIDLVVGSWNEAVARLLPGVDRVETLDAAWLARDRRSRGLPTLMRRAWSWRRQRYDLGINFEGDIRSNVLLWLSGASRRAGFGMAGGAPLLTDPVAYNPRAHVAANSMALVERALGPEGSTATPDRRPPAGSSRLSLPAEARVRAADLLGLPVAGGTPPLVGIHASGGREIKQWEPARFAEVASTLGRSRGATIVLTGSAADRLLVNRVAALLPADVRCIDLAGRVDVVGLAAVLERLDVLVTADTGPMHLAAAVGTPLVALFGPSDPARWGPLSPSPHIVRIDLPCSPCSRIRRPPARCVGHIPDCLAGISVARVCEAVVEVLDERGGGGANGR